MSSGHRFVQTLGKLGYPKASKLEGEDFDWLFETTHVKSFLDWFCVNVTEQNVASEEKLQAFSELKDSGKAVLDEEALEEVMKTCKPPSSDHMMEEMSTEKLEEELQALRRLRGLHLQRRNKLQMMTSANVKSCLTFKAKEEAEAKSLKETLSVLQVTSNKLNHELHALVDGIQKLMAFYAPCEKGSTFSSPIFLFKVLIDKYLSCEEESTVALTLFTKEHFYEGFTKCVEGSDEDFQLLRLEGNASDDPALEDKSKEMMRLQLAYISAKHKLIQAKAKHSSVTAGLKWMESNAGVMEAKASNIDKLKIRISSLKDEASQTEKRIDAINRETIPGLVRESAQLLNMPIVKGDYDLQIARYNLCASRQDIVCNHLMTQKASFELLQMGYELELMKQRIVNRQLEALIQELKESAEKLETRLTMMSDVTLLSSTGPRTNIDSKDHGTHGLFQILDGDNQQKLFRTYNGLESMAQKLSQDVASLQDQLAVSEQEQSLLISKLEANVKSLQNVMYLDGNELMLHPPELSASFQDLNSHLDKLNRVLLEVLEDLALKRKILQSSKFDRLEKQLYVYFYQNEDLLKTIIENLESQAGVRSFS